MCVIKWISFDSDKAGCSLLFLLNQCGEWNTICDLNCRCKTHWT